MIIDEGESHECRINRVFILDKIDSMYDLESNDIIFVIDYLVRFPYHFLSYRVKGPLEQ